MTNGAAIGYMILAAKNLNLERDLIRQLEKEMVHVMDFWTEEEAEEIYYKTVL